jgi:two-component system sensor histidine kinase KdpD
MLTGAVRLTARLALVCGLLALASAFHYSIRLTNTTVIALSFLLIVLATATVWGLAESLVCSAVATLFLNYFFLPPVGTWTIADPGNWVAMFSFLIVAVVASQLSERARRKTREAIRHQEEKARIEELARNAEMTRQKEKFKATLLDALAHELKTPLTSLKASISALRSDIPLQPAMQDELLSIVQEETDRLNRLVSEVLQMARIDAGTLRLNSEPVQVGPIISRALEISERLLDSRPVNVSVEPELPAIMADRELVHTVLRHLLDNAGKYSAPGKPIEIRAFAKNGFVHVCVEDQGPGLNEEESSRIFEPYYRGMKTASVPGMGMGLSIARDIIAAHAGRIWAESIAGRGTSVVFTLPMAAGKQE